MFEIKKKLVRFYRFFEEIDLVLSTFFLIIYFRLSILVQSV